MQTLIYCNKLRDMWKRYRRILTKQQAKRVAHVFFCFRFGLPCTRVTQQLFWFRLNLCHRHQFVCCCCCPRVVVVSSHKMSINPIVVLLLRYIIKIKNVLREFTRQIRGKKKDLNFVKKKKKFSRKNKRDNCSDLSTKRRKLNQLTELNYLESISKMNLNFRYAKWTNKKILQWFRIHIYIYCHFVYGVFVAEVIQFTWNNREKKKKTNQQL